MRLVATGIGALSVLAALACGGGLGVEGVWSGATATRFVPVVPKGHTTNLAFLPDGTLAVTVSDPSTTEVRFLRPDGAPSPYPDRGFGRPGIVSGWGLAVSPDGRTLAVALYDEIVLVPVAGGDAAQIPLDAADLLDVCTAPWRLAWAGDSLLADCSVGPPGVLFDVPSRSRLLTLPREQDGRRLNIDAVAASPDGTTLALRMRGERFPDPPTIWVDLRRAEDGSLLRTFTAEGLPEQIAFSRDGRLLAVSHPYFGLQVFDVADGTLRVDARYEGERGDHGVGGLAWGPTQLFRVGRRHGVSVHDPADGQVLGWLPRHAEDTAFEPPAGWPTDLSYANQQVAVSTDGRWLASIETRDGGKYAVRFWDLAVVAP